MVWVLFAPYFHHNHVAALRTSVPLKPRCLVGLLIKARPIRLLPPTVLTLEILKLQPPLALVPVSAELPAIPGSMHKRPAQQRRIPGQDNRAQIPLRPTDDGLGQLSGLANRQVARLWSAGRIGMRVNNADHLAHVLGRRVILRHDPKLFIRVSRGVLARDIPADHTDELFDVVALELQLGYTLLAEGRLTVLVGGVSHVIQLVLDPAAESVSLHVEQ